jgi:hypothetical protein
MALHFAREEYADRRKRTCAEIRARKDIEDLIHLEEYYEIERQTVESR